MLYHLEFRPKFVSEELNLVFDFSPLLSSGETLSSAQVSSTVHSGTDGSPSSMISGAESISTPNVTQLVIGGQSGTIYALTCLVTTSLGQTLKRAGLLTVIPEPL